MTELALYSLALLIGLVFAYMALQPLAVTIWVIHKAGKIKREIEQAADIAKPAELLTFVDAMKTIALEGPEDNEPLMAITLVIFAAIQNCDSHSQRIVVESLLWVIFCRYSSNPIVLFAILYRRANPDCIKISVTVTPNTPREVVDKRVQFEQTAVRTYTSLHGKRELVHS